ncbi:MAG: hypothetical protein L3J88_07050 [Gammaproteobacteria bacterium]|nr:hypothetical protein [Gammaproteobacteria bacterium]MCF6363089.1 hypothetical protein [Gammaproteobacteria bacterium]
MATVRGFVQKIEVGRAGLVRVTLIHSDGSSGVYVVRDIDGDPERFNERLTKIGILRDAMNRAEPVFIEHTQSESGNEIQQAARISRDQLDSPLNLTMVVGLVVSVSVLARNQTAGDREQHDMALVEVVTTNLGTAILELNLQSPERLVVSQQLEMIREAQAHGRLAQFFVSTENDTGYSAARGRIHAVALDNSLSAFGDQRAQRVDGFVESLSLIRAPFSGTGTSSPASSFAHVRFTTAPPFTGPGNTIGLTPFTPMTLDLFVAKGSLSYELFEAGLRDNLRMQVNAILIKDGDSGNSDDASHGDVGSTNDTGYDAPATASIAYTAMARLNRLETGEMSTVNEVAQATMGLVFAAKLLAHLASASRPVWITIARESLDHGPEGFACTDGVPSSDLQPQTLRDLRIPYPAAWRGLGCFNPGVYRFQFKLPGGFRVLVDNEELCLHDSDEAGIQFAHACLGGDHDVEIRLESWVCDNEFIMDVYQIR